LGLKFEPYRLYQWLRMDITPGASLIKWSVTTCSLIVAAFAPLMAAQPRPPADTWRKGASIRHPEKLSGLWLAEVHHRIFGLQIVLTTSAKKSSKAPDGVIQTCEQANIEVFEQMSSMRVDGDGNWFDADLPGASWTGNHLKIDSQGENPDAPGPEINLDLRFDPETETWTGRFHRNGLDEVATLRRPSPASGAAGNRFAGTWKRAGVANNCMHIAEGAGGELFAWSDDILAPDGATNAKGVRAPRDFFETYGFTAQVELHSAHNIFVRLKALSAVCCAIDVGGVLSQDGERIRSNTQSDNRRNPGLDDWLRVHGNSCLVNQSQ
jgi:hypothetical protein